MLPKDLPPDLKDEQKALITQYLAEFEGKITAAWYKIQENCDCDWGEGDDTNPLFMIFVAGASEGATINNDCWVRIYNG